MADPDFDQSKTHRYYSADCFNKAWELIAKSSRSPEETEEMIRLSQASLWHWTRRSDCTRTNMAIGYWQLARVYALAGRAEEARRYGQLCLADSPEDSPFLVAYAHESLARAEKAAGNHGLAAKHCAEARELADCVSEADDRARLLDDLKTLGFELNQ
jgi:tetratricopeptide (TPR) repeat protein